MALCLDPVFSFIPCLWFLPHYCSSPAGSEQSNRNHAHCSFVQGGAGWCRGVGSLKDPGVDPGENYLVEGSFLTLFV